MLVVGEKSVDMRRANAILLVMEEITLRIFAILHIVKNSRP